MRDLECLHFNGPGDIWREQKLADIYCMTGTTLVSLRSTFYEDIYCYEFFSSVVFLNSFVSMELSFSSEFLHWHIDWTSFSAYFHI
jgi:hypothetical protein